MRKLITALLALALMLTACNRQNSTAEPIKVELPVGVVESLSRNLKVESEQIEFNKITELDYSNTCLGLPSVDEQCAEMIIKGYQGIISLDGAQYEFRSDRSGERMRIVPIALKAAQSVLATRLNVNPEFVRWVSIEKVDWPDSCLGLEQPGMNCNMVITPGFRILLESGGIIFVFRTDLSGKQTVMEMFSN
jgi:hypothetical protein